MRLALSLHAADEALRSELMPVNDRYPLRDVLDACLRWHDRRKRQVFIEYLMLDGVNDRYEQARALAELLEPRQAFKVNLIPYNPTDVGLPRLRPRRDRGVPRRPRAAGRPDHRAAHPRPRHRRGVWAARRPRLATSRPGSGRARRPCRR